MHDLNVQTTAAVRKHRQPWPFTALLLAGLAAAAALLPLSASPQLLSFLGIDFQGYYAAGAAVLHGRSPYDFTLNFTLAGVGQLTGLQYVYTPGAAVMMVPLSLLPLRYALAAWQLVSVLAMQTAIYIALARAGVTNQRRRARLTLLLSFLALPLTAVLFTLQNGQVNLILMALVVLDLGRTRNRWRGVGVGLAAGIKLTPLIFIAYLLLSRQYPAARRAIITFAGTVAVGFIVTPSASWRYWTGTFIDTSRMSMGGVPPTWNQSLREIAILLAGSGPASTLLWLAMALPVGCAGLLIARRNSLHGNELAAIAACGVTGLLISPVSWVMHWVWCLIMMITASQWARGWKTILAPTTIWLLFAAQTATLAAPQIQLTPFTYAIPATGIIFLAILASPRTHHQLAHPDPRPA